MLQVIDPRKSPVVSQKMRAYFESRWHFYIEKNVGYEDPEHQKYVTEKWETDEYDASIVSKDPFFTVQGGRCLYCFWYFQSTLPSLAFRTTVSHPGQSLPSGGSMPEGCQARMADRHLVEVGRYVPMYGTSTRTYLKEAPNAFGAIKEYLNQKHRISVGMLVTDQHLANRLVNRQDARRCNCHGAPVVVEYHGTRHVICWGDCGPTNSGQEAC